MFKKDIFYKLSVLIVCFAIIISLCAWKSSSNKKTFYNIYHYNSLNNVELTETSDQLLEIKDADYNEYKKNSLYDFNKVKKLNDNEKFFLWNNQNILNLKLNWIKSKEEELKKLSELKKDIKVKFMHQLYPDSVFISNQLANNILKYLNQIETFKKLEENIFKNFKQLNDVLKTEFCDLNEFLVELEQNDKKVTSNKHYIKVRKVLMRFYSILFKLYGEDKIKKLISNFAYGSIKNKSNEKVTAGITVFSNVFFKQHMKLKESVFCSNMCKVNYTNGYWSSFNCAYVLIHEMGHAIDNFFTLNRKQSEKLNMTYFTSTLPLFKNISLDPFYAYCNSLPIKHDTFKNVSTLQEHVLQSLNKAQHDENDIAKSQHFKEETIFVFAPSKYAREVNKNNASDKTWRKEFFAECFAYWILTPDKFRDIRWAILNDYFLNKFGY